MRAVFVGGCPRSGTTLLGSMLGADERTITVPESQFKIPLLCADPFDGTDAVRRVRVDWRFRIWGVAPPVHANSFDTPSELLEALVRSYAANAGKTAPGLWVDHTPSNMQYAATLSRAFPDASFVHIVRDARGVAASLLKLDWGPTDALQAAEYWVKNLAYGLAVEQNFQRVARVRYEDLVGSPRLAIEKLCSTLGISYADDMVEAGGFTPPAYTTPIHRLIGNPPNEARAEAWRSELTRRQVELIESVTCDLLPLLGYAPEFPFSAKSRSSREALIAYLANPTRGAINKLQSRRRRRIAVRRLP